MSLILMPYVFSLAPPPALGPAASKFSAFWPFNGNTLDVAGGYNMSAAGTVTYPAGVNGQAITSTGLIDSTSAPSDRVTTNDWCIGGWFKPTVDAVQVMYAMQNGSSGYSESVYFAYMGGGTLTCAFRTAQAPGAEVTVPNYVFPGGHAGASAALTFMVLRLQGGKLSLFINGVKTGETTTAGIPFAVNRCVIGYQWTGIYNVAADGAFVSAGLSDSEISWMYNSGAGRSWTDIQNPDPYWGNVVSLLHFNGTDGSTTFTDQTGKTWTPSGNAQIDTAASKFGGAAGLFDGSGDYISNTDNTALDFGSGDFTVEFWLNTTQTTDYALLIGRDWGSGGWGIFLNGSGSSPMQIWCFDASPQNLVNALSSGYRDGNWHHIAWERVGNVFTLYVDGVVENSVTSSFSFAAGGNTRIGNDVLYGGRSYSGLIDDLRITKGVARYGSAFTPPTVAFADFGTVSLLHFNGTDGATTFTDVSGRTWTANGSAQIDTAQSKFGVSSLLLSGVAGTFVSTASSNSFNLASSDFTIECFVRRNTATTGAILSRRGAIGAAGWALGMWADGMIAFRAKVGGVWSDTRAASAAGAVPVGTWQHIALTRAGTVFRIFVQGVEVGTQTVAGAIEDLAETIRIGTANSAGEWMLNGHIDELRITRGLARYTAAFTPPTAPFQQ